METEILQFIKDLSYPALIGLALMIFQRAGFWGLLADFFRTKINLSSDTTMNEKLDLIKDNHLHEILNVLKRIENKLEKVNDDIIYIKAKTNGNK